MNQNYFTCSGPIYSSNEGLIMGKLFIRFNSLTGTPNEKNKYFFNKLDHRSSFNTNDLATISKIISGENPSKSGF